MTAEHPDDDALRDLLDGSLTAPQQLEIESRLSVEPALRDRLDALTDAAGFATTYIPPEPATPPATRELTRLIETLHATTPDSIPPSRAAKIDPADYLAPPRTTGSLGSLDNYEILGVVGQGGMGIVFRAHDPALQRTVAIKALSPALAAIPTARDSFLREARSAAALDHAHILPIHAVHQHGTLPYFVMPLVAGPALDDLLAPRTPLPVSELLRYATAVSSALGAAHAKGIVHRDIKPANILTDPESGRVWITDFGIAHPAGDSPGSLAGTPHYISPEQAAGGATTPASDLFSLGVLIYEMATATRPFDGETTADVLAAVAAHVPPPPSSLNPEIPKALDDLTAELLSKSPHDRPPSARRVTATLESIAEPGSARRRVLVFALVATTITAAAALLRPDDSAAPQPPGRKPLFSLFGDGRAFATLADALAATTPESATVLINSNATLETTPLTTPPHPVIIRAARGASPVLRFSEVDAPLFTATGPLELRHLTVVQRALRRGGARIPPVVHSAGSPVTVTHCRISRVAPAVGRVPDGDFALEVIPPIFRFEEASELALTRSEIYALRGVCVSALIPNDTTNIHVEHSIVATRRFIEVTGKASTRLTLTLDNNLLMTSAILDFLPNATHPHVEVSAHNNLFELRGGIVWARGRTPADFASTFSWSGSSNVYQIPHVAVHYGGAFDITSSDRPSQQVFDRWVDLPCVQESNSVSRNIKASGHLNLRNTALDTLTAENFRLHPKANEISPDLGPDVPYIGPGNARKSDAKTPSS